MFVSAASWKTCKNGCRALPKERRRPSKNPYTEELAQSQAELEAEENKLNAYLEELRGLGVEFKGPDGLCDFYSRMDGRDVFLCWRLGEPEVLYWHDLDCRVQRTSVVDGTRQFLDRRGPALNYGRPSDAPWQVD